MINAEFIQAIERLTRAADGKLVHVNGIDYATQKLYDTRVTPPAFPSLGVATLTGFVGYVRANIDDLNPISAKVMAHVASPTEVLLLGEAQQAPQLQNPSVTTEPVPEMGLMSRPMYLSATAHAPYEWDDEQFMEHEDFMLYIQQVFTDKGDLKQLKKVIGNIVNEDVKQANDDGVTQRVTTKTGAVLVGDATVPNPVKLHPMATFAEIPQPPVEFVLRVRPGRGDIPQVGLFPTDAGRLAWRRDAAERVAGYLMEKLSETELGKLVQVIY